MKSGVCDLCEGKTKNLWLLNLAKYDSLKTEERFRLQVCESCAEKIGEAFGRVLGHQAVTISSNGENEAVMVCPQCGLPRTTDRPKVPEPCRRCGTVFSVYSGQLSKSPKTKGQS